MTETLKTTGAILLVTITVLVVIGSAIFLGVKGAEYQDSKFIELCEKAEMVVVPIGDTLECVAKE